MTESFNRKLGRLAQNVSGTGSITTNAATASAWETARTITLGGDLSGSVSIDGTSNVSLTATVSGDSIVLGTDTTGDYVAAVAVSGTGLSVSGSGENATYTITSNATSANTASTIVARDASGNFSAGTITAALTGNASTATTLQTARTINGVSFNGSGDITVTAAAGTLTGNTLASGVTSSSLTSVGTLSSLTVSGDLTVDTNTLFVDSVNNRVGIGTASPSEKFEVYNGGLSVNSGTVKTVVSYAGTTSKFGTTTNHPLLFITNNTERARIDASGNVGVGTTSPSTPLHVIGNSIFGDTNNSSLVVRNNGSFSSGGGSGASIAIEYGGLNIARINNTGTGVRDGVFSLSSEGTVRVLIAADNSRGGDTYFNGGGNVGIGTTSPTNARLVTRGAGTTSATAGLEVANVNGNTTFFVQDNGTSRFFGSSLAETMRVNHDGNVGIGTTSPAVALNVSHANHGIGISYESSGTLPALAGIYTTGTGWGGGFGDLIVKARTDFGNNYDILFVTATTANVPVERARITTVGTLNVGTNPDSGAVGAYVVGYNGFAAQVSNNAFFTFSGINASGTRTFYVLGTGNVANTNGVYGTISDAKLKQDITDADSQWDDIKAIRFRKYRFKSDVEAKGEDAPYLLGVVAQELQAVSPGLVDAHPDTEQVEVEVEVEKSRPVMHEVEEVVTDAEGVESVVTKSVPMLDEDGQPVTETYTETETRTETRPTGTETLSVKQSVLLMKAAVALQEAMARIETLEARLAALET